MRQDTLFIGERCLGGQDERREEKGEGRGGLGVDPRSMPPLKPSF